MTLDSLRNTLEQLRRGELDIETVLARLGSSEDASAGLTEDAHVDLDRQRRCGFPEVVFCEGKTTESVIAIFSELIDRGQTFLGTRVSAEQAQAVVDRFPKSCHNPTARTVRAQPDEASREIGHVAVITAGTSDRPVAEEAVETLRWMGCRTEVIFDVGVAGPHRLAEHQERFAGSDAIVVIAGMEGALPSVVGGYVDCPVVAVPTSIGYGASFGGVAALLGMLNSCAANVTVVNIDAGFKGGYVAGLIAQRAAGTTRMQ